MLKSILLLNFFKNKDQVKIQVDSHMHSKPFIPALEKQIYNQLPIRSGPISVNHVQYYKSMLLQLIDEYPFREEKAYILSMEMRTPIY